MPNIDEESLQKSRNKQQELERLLEESRKETQELMNKMVGDNYSTGDVTTGELTTFSTNNDTTRCRYSNELHKLPNLELNLRNIANRDGVSNNNDKTIVSPLTDSSCTSAEMKTLQEMSLGGGLSDGNLCDATTTLVKKCTRDVIWGTTKFLTDESMYKVNAMGCDEFDGSIIGLLLKTTKYMATSRIKKLDFWRKYGPVVQRELNEIKSNRARAMKETIIRGM